MANKRNTYKRLPGRGRGISIIRPLRTSLWRADDHLLYVINHGYTEKYKKFHFNDIQAIVLHKSFRGQLLNAFYGIASVITFFVVLSGLLNKWPAPGMITSLFFFACFVVCLLGNIFAGPTCTCTIHTAAQKERLYSVGRIKVAHKLLNILSPVIEQFQGPVDDEKMQQLYSTSHMSETLQVKMPAPDSTEMKQRHRLKHMPKVRKHSSGNAQLALFLLLAIDCLMTLGCLWFLSIPWVLVNMSFFAAVNIMVVVALVKQQNTDIPKAVNILIFATLGYVVSMYLFGMIEGAVFSFNARGISHNSPAYYKALLTASPWDHPFRMFTIMFSALLSGIIAFPGITMILRFKRTGSTPPPPPIIHSPDIP